MEQYKTIKQAATAEFIERKSRFIGAICPVTTSQQANNFIAQIKSEHWQATHNCWAYSLRHQNSQRYSDDGEPSGTAGIPILEILRKEEILDAVIVVTRYFGGIMLGAGGLIRAYAQGAKIALDAGIRVTMAACVQMNLSIPYSFYDRFIQLCANYPLEILDTSYEEHVSVTLSIRNDTAEHFATSITELSAGSIIPKITGNSYAPFEM